MKKILYTAPVCMMFLLVFFVSCTQAPVQEKNNELDMGGKEYYFIGSFFPEAARNNNNAFLQEDPDAYETTLEEDAMSDKCLKTQEKLNCVIVHEEGFPGTKAEFAAGLSSGTVKADIICDTFASLLDYYKSGLLCDLYEISTLDATDEEKWGTEQRKEATTYRGALYAFPCQGSMYYPFTDKYNGAFVYNRDLYDSYGTGITPEELIEEGRWTFSGFLDIIPGVIAPEDENEKYGISLINSLPTISVYANGGDIIIKNDKGQYVFGYSRDNAVRALEWARDLSMIPGAIAPNDYYSDFEAGNATFALIPAERAIYSSVPNIGWIPFPYGPDVEYGQSYSGYFGYYEKGTAIVSNPGDKGRELEVGTIVNELFEPTDKFGKTGYDQYISRNFFNTPEDYEVFKSHGLNMHYDWSKEILQDKTVQEMLLKINDIIANPAAPVKAEMQAMRDVVNERICDDLNGKE